MRKAMVFVSLFCLSLMLVSCDLFGGGASNKQGGGTLDIAQYDGLWTGSFSSTLNPTQELELSVAVNEEERFVRFQVRLADTVIMVFFATFDDRELKSDEVTFSDPGGFYQDLSYTLNAQNQLSGEVSSVPPNDGVVIGRVSFTGSIDFSSGNKATIEMTFFDSGGSSKIGTGMATLSKN